MKKLWTATFVCLLLLFAAGCSSTPAGTQPLNDILKNPQVGQNVVVVGMADIKTELAAFRMFKLFNNDMKYIWVTLPEGAGEPLQGGKIRVTGAIQQKEFQLIGKVYYIDASKVRVE